MRSRTSKPFATVVYHPLKTDLDRLKKNVEHFESRAAWGKTRWLETTETDAGVKSVKQAIKSGTHVVMVSGGDGTVRAAAEALRGTKVPLAIIPQGTGNLLARNIGLNPNDTEAAVEAAFLGKNHAIDLGIAKIVFDDDTVEEHVFLVLAGMGLDARAIKATKGSLKKTMGWLAYVDAGLRTIIKDKPFRIHYSYNQRATKASQVFTVMIGNCGQLPGGALLIPGAKIDDGELDVVVLKPHGRFAWFNIWNKIGLKNSFLGKFNTNDDQIDLLRDSQNVSYLRAKQYALAVDQPEPIQLDGDDFGYALAVNGSVDPSSLVIRVLPEWNTDAFV